MNEVGADIWKLLEAGCAEEDLVQKLLSEYEVEREQAAADIREFIGILRERRMLIEL